MFLLIIISWSASQTILWQLKMVMFRCQHPKSYQNTWFVLKMRSISQPLHNYRSSPLVLSICRIRPFHDDTKFGQRLWRQKWNKGQGLWQLIINVLMIRPKIWYPIYDHCVWHSCPKHTFWRAFIDGLINNDKTYPNQDYTVQKLYSI